MEHIGKAFGFGRFSCVPPEASLVNIGLQMLVTYIVVATTNHPTEMRPKAFDSYITDIMLNSVKYTQPTDE